MQIDKIVITSIGFFIAIFVYWFFLGKKEKVVKVEKSSTDILVEGGYQPEVIEIPRGQTTVLHFTRKDPSACLEELVMPDFKVRKTLLLNKTVDVPLQPVKEGEFTYSCGMHMYFGKIIVKG